MMTLLTAAAGILIGAGITGFVNVSKKNKAVEEIKDAAETVAEKATEAAETVTAKDEVE